MSEASSILIDAQAIVDGQSRKIHVEEQARPWAVGDSPVSPLFDGTGMLYANDDEPKGPTLIEYITTRTCLVAKRVLTSIITR